MQAVRLLVLLSKPTNRAWRTAVAVLCERLSPLSVTRTAAPSRSAHPSSPLLRPAEWPASCSATTAERLERASDGQSSGGVRRLSRGGGFGDVGPKEGHRAVEEGSGQWTLYQLLSKTCAGHVQSLIVLFRSFQREVSGSLQSQTRLGKRLVRVARPSSSSSLSESEACLRPMSQVELCVAPPAARRPSDSASRLAQHLIRQRACLTPHASVLYMFVCSRIYIRLSCRRLTAYLDSAMPDSYPAHGWYVQNVSRYPFPTVRRADSARLVFVR